MIVVTISAQLNKVEFDEGVEKNSAKKDAPES